MKTILFQGDSITDALRKRDEMTGYGVGYVARVTGELNFLYPDQYQIYNRGVSGNLVGDVYARKQEDIWDIQPDFMSMLIGINDVGHRLTQKEEVDVKAFFGVYSQLIEEIKEAFPNILIMIMEPFVLEGAATKNYWPNYYVKTREVAEKARMIAEKYELKFVPLQKKIEKLSEETGNAYWLYDGVHPSAAGHEFLKREWMKAFGEMTGVR